MRSVMALALATAFLSALLSGCSSQSGNDHDAADPPTGPELQDALAAFNAGEPTSNIHRLGQWGSGSAEIDAWGNLLFVDAGSAVQIYDVSDASSAVEVGSVTGLPGILDVKVSDDGNYLFVGEDAEASMELPTGQTTATGGFYVVDVSNKAAPELVSSLSVGPRRGPHMVFYHQTTAGDELVFGANADVSINRFDRATETLSELARYSPNLATGFNRDPMVFDVLYQGWAHDMFVMEDPVANTTLMYVANWDAGLRIVDLADPSNPVEVGAWNDFPEGHAGNLHTVSTEWIGDRRITVGTVEVGFAVVGGIPYALHEEPSALYVWDTTDLSAPTLLAVWQNPAGLPSDRDIPEGGSSSTHNFQLEGGRVYLAHYSLPIFVLDVSSHETQSAPTLLGYHTEPSSTVWDVVLVDGVVYTSGSAGIVSLHYAPDLVGPDGIDSRA